MNILTIVIILFVLLEGMNVFILYFFPTSNKGNSVGIFKAFEESKQYPEIYNFIRYLINWIAGTKLIFIALLIVVIIHGDEMIIFYSIVALIISISTFFWRLYPMIKSMDKNNQISPMGYSKTLAIMIASFIIIFIFSLAYYFFFE